MLYGAGGLEGRERPSKGSQRKDATRRSVLERHRGEAPVEHIISQVPRDLRNDVLSPVERQPSEGSVTTKRRMLCAVLAFSLALAAGSPTCRAETASTANSTPRHEPPAKQPAFCFQGAAPDRQEASRYADRAQRDASRASKARAGDADETVFMIGIALFAVACLAGTIYLTSVAL